MTLEKNIKQKYQDKRARTEHIVLRLVQRESVYLILVNRNNITIQMYFCPACVPALTSLVMGYFLEI